MPVHRMHAGEELLWIVIPAFVIIMLVDIFKRRQLRRQEQEGSGADAAPDGESGESTLGRPGDPRDPQDAADHASKEGSAIDRPSEPPPPDRKS